MSIKKPGTARGFTLIELMIVVAIAAILALIVYPNYMDSVRKSRRQDAITALNSLQLDQERYRANHPAYGSLADLTSTYGTTGIGGTTANGYYTLAITSPTATGYIATATAVAGKSQANDSAGGVSCATLSVNQEQPVDSNPVQPLSLQKACWGRY
ncbi:MAG: type IV pilin protein [Stenotrophobium sp.]